MTTPPPSLKRGLVDSMSMNGMCGGESEKGDEGMNSKSTISHPLYGHGVCKWPGCETVCDDFSSFLKYVRK